MAVRMAGLFIVDGPQNRHRAFYNCNSKRDKKTPQESGRNVHEESDKEPLMSQKSALIIIHGFI